MLYTINKKHSNIVHNYIFRLHFKKLALIDKNEKYCSRSFRFFNQKIFTFIVFWWLIRLCIENCDQILASVPWRRNEAVLHLKRWCPISTQRQRHFSFVHPAIDRLTTNERSRHTTTCQHTLEQMNAWMKRIGHYLAIRDILDNVTVTNSQNDVMANAWEASEN